MIFAIKNHMTLWLENIYPKRPVTGRNSLDFVGGPVVKTALPLKGVWIPSLVGQDPNPGFLAIEKNLAFPGLKHYLHSTGTQRKVTHLLLGFYKN